MKFKRAKYF